MGKSAANDAHDGDDDELQRFSKSDGALSGGGREHEEHKRDKERCRCEA